MELEAQWRGGDLDRLLDEAHAQLVGASVSVLRDSGWAAEIEVTYSHYGERGSLDILGCPSRSWPPPLKLYLLFPEILAINPQTELWSDEEEALGHAVDLAANASGEKINLPVWMLAGTRRTWPPHSAIGDA